MHDVGSGSVQTIPIDLGSPMGQPSHNAGKAGLPHSFTELYVGHRSEVILEYQELVEGKDLSAKIAKVSRMQLMTSLTLMTAELIHVETQ